MTRLTRRDVLAGLAAAALPHPAQAALRPYELVPDGTTVSFTFDLAGILQSGTMPIRSASIALDLSDLANSKVDVLMDVAKARTRMPIAKGPMLSASVLDASTYPTIRFRSTRIQLGQSGRISDGAQITGDLTLRGITRPITLQAALYRQRGTATQDLNELSIRLRGALNRHDFGASGYADLVQDTVGLDIRAEIKRKD